MENKCIPMSKYYADKYRDLMQQAKSRVINKEYRFACNDMDSAYIYITQLENVYKLQTDSSMLGEPPQLHLGINPEDVIVCFDVLVQLRAEIPMQVDPIPEAIYHEIVDIRKPNVVITNSNAASIVAALRTVHTKLGQYISAMCLPDCYQYMESDITTEEFHERCEDERKAKERLANKRLDAASAIASAKDNKEAVKEKTEIKRNMNNYTKEYTDLMRKMTKMFKHKRYDKMLEVYKQMSEDYAMNMLRTVDRIRDAVYLSMVPLAAQDIRSMVAATKICSDATGIEYDSLTFLTKVMRVQTIAVKHSDDGYTPQKFAMISKMVEPMHDACLSMRSDAFLLRLISESESRAKATIQEDGEDGITEECKDVNTARKFVSEVQDIAKKYDANFFVVTDGASAYSNGNGSTNPAVKNAREAQVAWEKENGADPNEDWSKNEEIIEEATKNSVFTEASLSESLIFGKLNDSSSITKRIADIIRTGTVVERSFIEEQYNQMTKTRLSPLVDKVLDAYDHDDIVLIYNKSVHLTVALPFTVMQFKGKFRALIFIADFSALTKDGTSLNIEMKKLYTIMEAALVGLKYYTKPQPFQNSSVIAKLTAGVYAEMGLRILNKEFALSLDTNAYNMVSYAMARFYLSKVLGMTSADLIDSYARNTCKSPDNTSMELVKGMYDDTVIDNLEDLLQFLKKLNPKMERLTFRYYFERWISSYMIGSTLAIDNFPYLYYVMLSVLIGSFMINNTALNDPIKNMKGMQHFHGEVARLV